MTKIKLKREEYNRFGKLLYSGDTEIQPMRVQALEQNNQGADGGQTMAEYRIFVNGRDDIKRTDRVVYGGKEFQIKRFYPALDSAGQVHHYQVDI